MTVMSKDELKQSLRDEQKRSAEMELVKDAMVHELSLERSKNLVLHDKLEASIKIETELNDRLNIWASFYQGKKRYKIDNLRNMSTQTEEWNLREMSTQTSEWCETWYDSWNTSSWKGKGKGKAKSGWSGGWKGKSGDMSSMSVGKNGGMSSMGDGTLGGMSSTSVGKSGGLNWDWNPSWNVST